MNISAIAGMVMAFGMIIFGMILEGGHLSSIMQPTAAIIVLGGTGGTCILQFPMYDILKSFALLKEIFLSSHHGQKEEMIKTVINYAQIARRESVFALEKEMKNVEDPFIKTVLGMVTDGRSPKEIYEAGDIEIENYERDCHGAFKFWEAFGGYCPTVGILGAVLGLIHVMENLSDPSKLGGGIAVAFVATLYGVGAANLIALPFSNLIKHKIEEDVILKKIVIIGLIMVVEGRNPKNIQTALNLFLPAHLRSEDDAPKA
jgi:chemotaxis protein MotA